MSEPKFRPRPPAPISYGFTAGILRITWQRDPPTTITGREGQLFIAQISEIHDDHEMLRRDVLHAALVSLVVRSPDGEISRIAGIESHCTTYLTRGAPLGLLLVSLGEP